MARDCFLTGVSGIDIDDTIKVSHVRDRISLLKHTFALEPLYVDDMPRLYRHLDGVLKPAWYYLSASPYNLYPMLRSFISDNYPQGQLLLREMSWQELESFVVSLTVGTQKYKERELDRLVTFLPERKWVFIGDSTQKDPEAYAAAYKRNPEKVRRIWIRVVEGVNRLEERRLNSDERFATAFKDVPREVWRTFKHAGELEALVGEIV
jgi:phosphatidate phosphatase APP1